MPRYQVKPREDGRGPYRWSHVVKNPMGGGLRQGSIYRQMGDDLNPKIPPNCATFVTRAALKCGEWHDIHAKIQRLCLPWR